MRSSILLAILLIFICCKTNNIIHDFKKQNHKIDKIETKKDFIFNLDCTIISFKGTISNYFKTKNVTKIFIFEEFINEKEVEKTLNSKFKILGYSKTFENNNKTSSNHYIIKYKDINYSLRFDSKIINNKKTSILFKAISEKNIKYIEDYLKIKKQL